MEKNIIYAHSCDGQSLVISKKEVLRYMACKEETDEVKAVMDFCLPEVTKVISPKGSFGYFSLKITNDETELGDMKIQSKSLAKNLAQCRSAVAFGVTLGAGFDRLVSKFLAISPAAAICADAIGTAAIESYADKLCGEISNNLHKESLYPRPRFSPGYGDFDLKYQKDILKMLNSEKICGITLTRSLMMTPTKSVTAVVGFGNDDIGCGKKGCEACTQTECQYRR